MLRRRTPFRAHDGEGDEVMQVIMDEQGACAFYLKESRSFGVEHVMGKL